MRRTCNEAPDAANVRRRVFPEDVVLNRCYSHCRKPRLQRASSGGFRAERGPLCDVIPSCDTEAINETLVYGLDIETDTAAGGLDPRCAAIVAIALSGPGWSSVLDGGETKILKGVDQRLADLEPGVIVTWNGARFDLPFIHDRAALHHVELGLRMRPDDLSRPSRDPLPGHIGGYRASWYEHEHLDAYVVYRNDVGASLNLPCGLKRVARMVGLEPVVVDREAIHKLSPDELAEYVASDAVLTRELALRRWPTASLAIDKAWAQHESAESGQSITL